MGAKMNTAAPSAMERMKIHFFLQAMNIITKPMPTMIRPELKLLAMTIKASGAIRTISIPQLLHSSIFFPSRVITTASTRITVTFTSSVGWNRTDLVPSHRFCPLTLIPRLVKFTRNIQI